jgi:hypothetical protein
LQETLGIEKIRPYGEDEAGITPAQLGDGNPHKIDKGIGRQALPDGGFQVRR